MNLQIHTFIIWKALSVFRYSVNVSHFTFTFSQGKTTAGVDENQTGYIGDTVALACYATLHYR